MEFNFLILSSAHRCLAALPPYIRRMTCGKFGVNAFLGRPMKRLGPSQMDLISTGGVKPRSRAVWFGATTPTLVYFRLQSADRFRYLVSVPGSRAARSCLWSPLTYAQQSFEDGKLIAMSDVRHR